MGIPKEEFHFVHPSKKGKRISVIAREWNRAKEIIDEHAVPIALMSFVIGLIVVDSEMTTKQKAHAACYMRIVPSSVCQLLPK